MGHWPGHWGEGAWFGIRRCDLRLVGRCGLGLTIMIGNIDNRSCRIGIV